MQGPWVSLLWLVISLGLLVVLNRWLSQHVQGFLLLLLGSPDVVIYLHYLLLLPGIVLHELSHWTTAQLLGVETKGISILPRKGRGKQVLYGSVKIVSADAVRDSLIGLAPLIAGSTAVLLCASLGLGIMPLSTPTSLDEFLGYLAAPNILVWLYLIFAISNAMLPSASDREPWLPVILFLGLVLSLLVATNLIAKIPQTVADAALFMVSYLAYAFTLTVVVDALVALPLWLGETAIAYARGSRVQY